MSRSQKKGKFAYELIFSMEKVKAVRPYSSNCGRQDVII